MNNFDAVIPAGYERVNGGDIAISAFIPGVGPITNVHIHKGDFIAIRANEDGVPVSWRYTRLRWEEMRPCA